jgi:hypothetical protein
VTIEQIVLTAIGSSARWIAHTYVHQLQHVHTYTHTHTHTHSRAPLPTDTVRQSELASQYTQSPPSGDAALPHCGVPSTRRPEHAGSQKPVDDRQILTTCHTRARVRTVTDHCWQTARRAVGTIAVIVRAQHIVALRHAVTYSAALTRRYLLIAHAVVEHRVRARLAAHRTARVYTQART